MQDEILVSELSVEQNNSELVMKENDVMESNQEEDAAKMEIQNLTDVTEFKSIQGEPDQVCESLEILSLIQSRYIHILSNEFKGNASGKIGKAEAMICDCVYDKG